MNINGARNRALMDGQKNSHWSLVLDGSCYLPRDSYENIRKDMTDRPFARYLIIKMIRVGRDLDLERIALPNHNSEEPQIAVHCLAKERFDERYPYGFRDKTELFSRIGVPGPWDKWHEPKWLPRRNEVSNDFLKFKYSSGFVTRLPSGPSTIALDMPAANGARFSARNTAILNTISAMDEKFDAADCSITQFVIGSHLYGSKDARPQ